MRLVHFPHEILSPAELSAARLDGVLSRVGDAYAPADGLEHAAIRAASLRPLLGDRLAAIGLTAAWIHGALGVPPEIHHVQRGAERISRRSRHDVRFRDTALDEADTVILGGVRVADITRTLVEFAREASDPEAAAIARRLATPTRIAEALAWLQAHTRFPGRRPATTFLAGLASADPGPAGADQEDVTR